MTVENVYIYRTSPESLKNDINKLLDSADFKKLNPDKEIFIKINANYDKPWPGCNTSLWFLDALFINLKKKGFNNIKVIEGDLKLQPATHTIHAVGIDKLLNKHNLPFVPIENLPRDNELPVLLKNAQFISTPVFHTHTFAKISIATKNLYGLLPVYREKYHSILADKLIDTSNRVKVFSIVDGTVGLEGGSMRMGNPVKCDLLMAGWNPLAIDLIASHMMGFVPDEIPIIKRAKELSVLPTANIIGDYTYDTLPRYHFRAEQPKLSVIDLYLRHNKLTRNLFSYGSFFDVLGNKSRRLYLSLIFQRKYKKIANGDWTDYLTYWESLNNPGNNA